MCVLSPACIEAARTGPPELVIARWLSRNIDYAANGHREWSRNNGRRRDQGVVADCKNPDSGCNERPRPRRGNGAF